MSSLVLDAGREHERLSALRAYDILDTPAERDYDDIAALAAQLCGTPIALVSLVDSDRQWFKSRVGLQVCETDRSSSFCALAMHGDEVMQVPDAHLDPRFADNPLVTGAPHIRFYAGAPLVTPGGQRLGSLCVIDREPRLLTPGECRSLRTLARHVVTQLELRQYARGMAEAHRRLSEADHLKDEFLARITHEVRTPLTSINGYLEVLQDAQLVAGPGAAFLERIQRNSDRLMALVDDMLLAARMRDRHVRLNRTSTDLASLARTATEQNSALATSRNLTITADAARPVVAEVDTRRIGQALDRLILNAIKFTERGSVTVAAAVRDGRPVLEVRDTGIGIAPADRERVLAPFRRSSAAERAEIQGSGLGLTIVAAIVDAHGGTVEISDNYAGGTTITLTFPS